jgi:hypothetical protein
MGLPIGWWSPVMGHRGVLGPQAWRAVFKRRKERHGWSDNPRAGSPLGLLHPLLQPNHPNSTNDAFGSTTYPSFPSIAATPSYFHPMDSTQAALPANDKTPNIQQLRDLLRRTPPEATSPQRRRELEKYIYSFPEWEPSLAILPLTELDWRMRQIYSLEMFWRQRFTKIQVTCLLAIDKKVLEYYLSTKGFSELLGRRSQQDRKADLDA